MNKFLNSSSDRQKIRKGLFPFSQIKLKQKEKNINNSFLLCQKNILGKTTQLLKANAENTNNKTLYDIFHLKDYQNKSDRKKNDYSVYGYKNRSKSSIEMPSIYKGSKLSAYQDFKNSVYVKTKKNTTNTLPDTSFQNSLITSISMIGKTKNSFDQSIGYTFSKEKSFRELPLNNNNHYRRLKSCKIIKNKSFIRHSSISSFNKKYEQLMKNADLSIKKSESIGSLINWEKNTEKKISLKKLPPEPKDYLELLTLEKAKLKECKENLINVRDEKSKNILVLKQGSADLMNYCDVYNKLDDSLFYIHRKKVEEEYPQVRRAADIEVIDDDDEETKEGKNEVFMDNQYKIKKIIINLNQKKSQLIKKINAYNKKNDEFNNRSSSKD